ncbi:putative nucleic acid-binding protein [Brevundimonas nasdae]|uniref:Ribonuclease VapC n=1 Tax=Brevundimonas nasdae TaxID=172043 RepID=A0ABX8TH23_9CAUL|nr:type II toxin-antitoxin system VapC family toxin [Brevundimonas nasdae]MBK6025620.1 type II toxin-antitoxin system VapC family toxin [Brevundimonas nasdae]MDQ0452252.1 putative nucleic acid-binding protein [Brevundimonas nasdae]QYC09403.1 type II toxin-antitoxin system VapC family toxin [Brevundimonas nasdae]QYC15451.1 type II toxin-antitoxin system VapC family toxin [Brevundimonas nasdae]
MTVYLDTSVLMSLFQNDKHTERASTWIADVDDFVMSSWTVTEFSSALAVRTRMRNLHDKERREFELQLDQWLSGRVILSVIDNDMVEARRLVRNDVRLRAPDGLHLALAVRHGCRLATLDEAMAAVARDIGLTVIVP